MKTSRLLIVGFCLTFAIVLTSPVTAQFASSIAANASGTITTGDLNCGTACTALGVCNSPGSSSAVIMRWNLGLPTTATIYTASLSLPVIVNGAGLPKLVVYPVEANWAPITGVATDSNPCSSGAPGAGQPTYESRAFGSAAWSNPAGANGTIILELTPLNNQVGDSAFATRPSAALLALVRSWVANPSTNYGLVVVGPNTTTSATAVYFGTPVLNIQTDQAVPTTPPITPVRYTPPTLPGRTPPGYSVPSRYITTTSTNSAAIIGGVIGGVVVVIFVISLVTIFLRGGSSTTSYRSTYRGRRRY